MIDGQVELQKAIFAAGKASDPVGVLIGDRIYDSVPQNAAFPYSSFGGFDTSGLGGSCDTGIEIDVQIDSWSRAVGTVEAKAIGAAWAELLTPETLAPEGWRVTIVRVLSLRGQRGLDGLTSQSILRLRIAMSRTA